MYDDVGEKMAVNLAHITLKIVFTSKPGPCLLDSDTGKSSIFSTLVCQVRHETQRKIAKLFFLFTSYTDVGFTITDSKGNGTLREISYAASYY